jgi:hypothetical protein
MKVPNIDNAVVPPEKITQGGKGCTVEFMTLAGKTIAVVTLLANQVRPIGKDEIAHARHVAMAA